MAATILVVTDSSELGALLHEAVSAAGYTVRHSHDYTFDLHDIARDPPDLILFDLAAGQETRGWQRVQMLRLHAATVAIPALVCTMQKALVEELEGHLLAQGIGCMLKPFTAAQLLAVVQQTLAAHPHTALQSDDSG